MNAKLLGFFSGFPTRCFTDAIADVLKAEIQDRDNLVFISAQPEEYSQNDDDAYGMHQMFAMEDMAFGGYTVIDDRTSSVEAIARIRGASCIFLMGGNATLQIQLIKRKNILEEIRQSNAVILGVSAGSMNMGKQVVDIYESPIPYEGIGFLDITLKAHYPLEDEILEQLRNVSMKLPVCLMEDESAIFCNRERIWRIGRIYRMFEGKIIPLT